MIIRKKRLLIGIMIGSGALAINSCIDPYNPSTTTANPAYLVVDGFLNSGNKSCTITLTHTVPLTKDSAFMPPPETGATVQIEADDGAIFPLTEAAKGVYSTKNLSLDETRNYRLKIITKNKQYLSDFVPVVKTPAIDSITYSPEQSGLHVNVNTHDPANNTHYYMWNYSETWAYDAAYDSEDVLQPDMTTLPRAYSFFSCYRSDSSTSLLLNSSTQLSQDIISEFPLTIIPWQSAKLKKKYSILVKQQGLTEKAFEYWQQIKKNTENLGTLFGPLPSKTIGNIQCVSNAEEPVIGYFSAGSTTELRIFITASDVRRPANAPAYVTGYEICSLDTYFFANGGVYGELVEAITSGPFVIGWKTTGLGCVDCRLQGGTLTKPDFWQ